MCNLGITRRRDERRYLRGGKPDRDDHSSRTEKTHAIGLDFDFEVNQGKNGI